ncbi:hypothetical protein BGW39_006989 [Mortierella sp. 14UC]|nr:hypothetical protein BGW39_006989 [Mortierella sp. 14UC]
MTTVGSLPADLAPGNEAAAKSAMDLPPSPTNSVPFIVATSADDDKAMAGPINGGSPMRFLQACSKLDMEPNPFEQSFAGGAGSEKADSVGPSTGTGLETPKPVLPPIASMSGRLAPGTDQFGWDAQSLRMGPLSPSMLEGPQQPINIEGKTQNPLPITSFPPAASSINTVFTSGAPVAENGLPYVGLPGPLPGPPPVAIQQQQADPYPSAVYNQTHPTAQPQLSHQQQPSHPHHPAGPPGGSGPRPPQHFAPPPTHQQQQQQPHGRYLPQQAQQASQHNMNTNMNTNNNNNNNNSHMNQYGNLHLLSQQAQASRGPWIKRESTDSNGGAPFNQPPHPHAGHPHHLQSHSHPSQPHPNAHPGPYQNSGQGIPGVGRSHPSRNSIDSGFNQGTRRSRVASEDFSDDSEQSSKNSANGGDHSGSNSKKKAKPGDEKMDEEEKRRNFLERNRQAALKCRQRKKQWLTNLQAKVEYLTNDNEHLQGQTATLRDEIIHLKALLLAHKDCPVAQANGVYADSVGLPSHSGMMSHSRPPHPMQQQQQQQLPGPLRGGLGPAPGQPRGSMSHPPPPSHQQQSPQQQQQHQQHSHGPGPLQAGGGGGPRMMNQPGPGPISQYGGQVGPMGNSGGGRPMSMMQDITPSASPNQGQRY